MIGHDLVRLIAGEHLSLRPGRNYLAGVERLADPDLYLCRSDPHRVSRPDFVKTVERDGELGCYLQWGAMVDGAGLRIWDVAPANVTEVLRRYPRVDFKR